ncbi:sulfurtransferase TusA family protein [Kushneria konosiri]
MLETFENISQMKQAADQVLDATGLDCPMPLLKARQALASLKEGQHLYVVCTDPGSWRDFESFAAHTAHQLAGRRHEGDTWHYILTKGC